MEDCSEFPGGGSQGTSKGIRVCASLRGVMLRGWPWAQTFPAMQGHSGPLYIGAHRLAARATPRLLQ